MSDQKTLPMKYKYKIEVDLKATHQVSAKFQQRVVAAINAAIKHTAYTYHAVKHIEFKTRMGSEELMGQDPRDREAKGDDQC